MKEIRYRNGLLGFEPRSEEDRVSEASAQSLVDAGWNSDLVKLIEPYLKPKSPLRAVFPVDQQPIALKTR